MQPYGRFGVWTQCRKTLSRSEGRGGAVRSMRCLSIRGAGMGGRYRQEATSKLCLPSRRVRATSSLQCLGYCRLGELSAAADCTVGDGCRGRAHRSYGAGLRASVDTARGMVLGGLRCVQDRTGQLLGSGRSARSALLKHKSIVEFTAAHRRSKPRIGTALTRARGLASVIEARDRHEPVPQLSGRARAPATVDPEQSTTG